MVKKLMQIIQYRKENIAKFYKDYCARLERVMELENEQKSGAEVLEIWTENYHQKSEEIRRLYEENEQQLEIYIYPLLDGRVKINQRIATTYLNEIIKMYDMYYDDALVILEIVKQIIKYQEEHLKKDLSQYIIVLSIAAVMEDGLGVDSHFEKAVEYNTMVTSYVDHYKELSPRARRCMFYAFHNRIISETYRKYCNIEDLYVYLREARSFYDNLENRRYDEFEYEWTLRLVQNICNNVVLSIARNKICCLTGFSNDAAENAIAMYDRIFLSTDDKQTIAPLVYINYLMAQYYKKEISAKEAFEKMYDAYMKAERNIDYSNVMFLGEPVYEYTIFGVTEMLCLLQKAGYEEQKTVELSRQIVDDVFKIYEDIPYQRRGNQTKNFLLTAYKYILPYYHVNAAQLEVLLRATISRENSTAIHTNLVVNLATELIKSVIRYRPDLLMGLNGYENIKDVEEHAQDILGFVKEAAFCHDIGKIAVAGTINIQYRRLAPIEEKVVMEHTIIGAEILQNVPRLEQYANISMGHHVSYDQKKGYPGTYDRTVDKGAFWVDLIRICDHLDAATDHYGRVYKPAKTYDQFLQELKEGKGTQYNPDLVDLFFTDSVLSDTMRYLTSEGRDSMLLGIYRLLQ